MTGADSTGADSTGALSIGVAAAVGADVAARLAPAVEAAGFHALWVNDTPGNDALAVLAAAARETDALVLATGVLPVDRRPPAEILDRVSSLGLPEDRLVLGIGSGGRGEGALARVTDAAAALRSATAARVVVGALGPKMRRLGAEASDGLLLSWLTPEIAARQAEEGHALAPAVHVAVYVRSALDPAALPRLDRETAAYASYPAYAANFERLGIAAADTTVGPGQRERLSAYRAAADEVVLRAITAGEQAEDYLRFIEAVAAAG
ncbi:LLM class flavin-dependent oxidoreductase [Microbacterium flavescens]|jgi:alkanesulfonate monooxygenase SsuD/methylene tetrahydromethanopterin reductase-like flavin-dependent oxidoreductase (luciferase family)|uniref:LLM class flavin-dependent oxidoreductase n=1 Tax=Microbacterium flavescens TaxID=69366 RepID=UPI001BDED19C|nr:LLM class flavin-dependent oxidoreductase [Microbacterium flavescens]